MKIVYALLFYITVFSFSTQVNAQGLDWNKISFGGFAQFSATGGDLNKFWGNILAAGILAQYNLGEKFLFEASIAGSYLKPAGDDQSKIPNIVFFNVQAFLKYNFISKENLSFNISPGFTNTTFIFTGDAADKAGDNFIEHEFGVSLSTGVEFKFIDGLYVESYLSGQNIFSSPDNLALYSFGLKFILR